MSRARNLADLLDSNGDVVSGALDNIDLTTKVSKTGDSMTGDLSFGDNNKANFGAGNDLQIYHDGTHSFITDAGTGDLYIRGSSAIRLQNAAGESYMIGSSDGAVYLRYDDSNKLATTSTGIDVTGTMTADLILADNGVSGDGDDYAAVALNYDHNCWGIIYNDAWIGGNNGWGSFWAGSADSAYQRVSGDPNPNEHVLVGGGNKRYTFDLDAGGSAYFDGSLSQNAYDYAEYFEWSDGNPDNEDRRGYSVVLTSDGTIRKATAEDDAEDIIGVISGTAAVIGDAAIYDWQGKFEIDEWGTPIYDTVDQLTWKVVDADGNVVERHSYDEDRVPEGVDVPEDVARKTHRRKRVAADYDESLDYLPRDRRQEWDTVGLLGKVRVRDDSPKNPRWLRIKVVNGKELWLLR